MGDFRLKLRVANRSGGGSGGGSEGGSYSSAYTVNTTGWLTVPIAAALGEIPLGTGVSIGGLSTQLDVKNKWSDNSAKFAILTAKLASTGSKAIVSAVAPTGSFVPTAPVFSVQFVITAGSGAGNTYTAALGPYSGVDVWLSGSNVIEWRKQVTPTKTGSVAHDNLSVIFDVRSYSDGDHRINVQVLNARDNALMDNTTYSCTFIDAGSTVYTAPAGMKQYSFTAWQKIVYLGSGNEATVTLDFTKFYSTYQLPKPLAGIANTDYTADLADATKYGPLQFGGYWPGELNAPGLNPWLGPFGRWDMQFLVNQAVSQRAVIVHNAFNGLSAWTQARITRNDDTLYYLTDSTEGAILMKPTSGYGYPIVLRTPVFPDLGGSTAYAGARRLETTGALDDEHIPQVGLIAYLVTGERADLDAAKHFVNSSLFRTQQFANTFADYATDGSQIRIDRNAVPGAYGVSVTQQASFFDARAIARTMRNVFYTAQMLPDTDADRTYFLNLGNDNLAWLSYYNSKRTAPGTQWGDGAVGFDSGGALAGSRIYDSTTGTTAQTEPLIAQIYGHAELAWNVYWANLQGIFTNTPGATTFAKRLVGLNVALVTNPTLLPVAAGLGAYNPSTVERTSTSGTGLPFVFPATFTAFAKLNVNAQGFYVQAAAATTTISANASTFVITASTPIFSAANVGDPIRIWGPYGSNWLDQQYRDFGAGPVRIAYAGVYYIVAYTDSTHVTLDRAPCSVNETGGTVSVNNAPLVIGGTGVQSRLAIYLATYWGLTNATAAKTACDAFASGGIDTDAKTVQSGYALVIPQS